MAEQFIFIILSIVLFCIVFFKMIKNNDTGYVPLLAIEALGITIDFILLISNKKINLIVKFLIYFMSVILPAIVIFLEKKNINIMSNMKMSRVNFYIAIGNYKKAKAILLRLTEQNNEVYDFHKKLAVLYEREGGMRKAIDEYVQCIDINKQDYDSYYKVATLLQDLDRKPEAIEMLNSLLSKKPDYIEATYILGDLLIEQKSYKEAAMVYMDSLKYNPVDYELNYNLGIVYTLLNDFNNAKQCYEKAAELNHLAYNAKYSLAQIALLYKDLDKAEKYFMQALNEEELSADCYFELSKINIMKGNKDLAIKYANLAIDLNSKKIAQKIEKEPLFMTIRTKISIPFNLEEKEDMPSFSEKERISKRHLENTTDITSNMGYGKVVLEDTGGVVKEDIQEEKQKE
ncbi:MAG: tetratricopeptide repeat protein [Clostridia bacterium]|nr:tetratricopeptide repeat protein [Clostridia bacterium]